MNPSPAFPAVAILQPAGDTRTGGVERFTANLRAALTDCWEVQLFDAQPGTPKLIAQLGGRFLWESRMSTRPLQRSNTDLLVTNGTLGWGAPSARRRIHVFHGTMWRAAQRTRTMPTRERLRHALGGAAAEILAARGTTTVAVSRSAAAEMRTLYRITPDHVIENGVDTTIFRPRDRAEARDRLGLPAQGRYALFAGRAEARKGVELLEEACALSCCQLVVASARPIGSGIHLGLLTPEELAWAYAAADCVVHPSRYEACSFVTLEALSAGVPVVTTDVGWVETLLERVPGYAPLVADPAADSLARAINVATTEDIRPQVERARESVIEHNSAERFSERWRSLCQRLLEG